MKKLLVLVMVLFMLGSCEVTSHGTSGRARVEIGVDATDTMGHRDD